MEDFNSLLNLTDVFANYKFVVYKQNNSDGVMLVTRELADYVIFQMPVNTLYNDWSLSDYFDTFYFYPNDEWDLDCSCCGARWENLGYLTFNEIDHIVNDHMNGGPFVLHDLEEQSIICNTAPENEYMTNEQVEEFFLAVLLRRLREYDSSYYSYKNHLLTRSSLYKKIQYYSIINKLDKKEFIDPNKEIDCTKECINKKDEKDSDYLSMFNELTKQPTDIIKSILHFV